MKYFRFSSLSLNVLIFLCAIIFVFRLTHFEKKEITWDVFGYYLPLPATFIYDDPMLNDRSWVDQLNEEKQLSGTVYQISTTEENKPIYFFLFGMSFFYAIFFFVGYFVAYLGGFPLDGFSEPYQISLIVGCMIYTFIGLYYLRKILLHFSSDRSTAIVLVLIVLGTNYSHHMTLKNLETVNVLFMLASVVIWNTIQWHTHFKQKNLIVISSGIALMALVKPSEILFICFPLLYGITNIKSIQDKWMLINSNRKQFFIAAVVFALLVLPQILYWLVKTGSPIYDTYKNPGVGLDLFSPHILNTLFSYRKGWFVYTPMMIFSFLGLRLLYRKDKGVFIPTFITFLISFYIVSSWTEWWYGAGFSMRPLITYYSLLSIPMVLFVETLIEQKRIVQFTFIVITSFFLFLNQFQWWQLRHYILDPYRTTKEYFWAIFLKKQVNKDKQKLLLLQRDFTGKDSFTDSLDYRPKVIFEDKFSDKSNGILFSDAKEEFTMPIRIPYRNITGKDHVWLSVSFDYKTDNQDLPILVAICMERKNGAYGYKTFELENDVNHMKTANFYFLTPEIRSEDDVFKIDLWKRSPGNVSIDNLKIRAFERKVN